MIVLHEFSYGDGGGYGYGDGYSGGGGYGYGDVWEGDLKKDAILTTRVIGNARQTGLVFEITDGTSTQEHALTNVPVDLWPSVTIDDHWLHPKYKKIIKEWRHEQTTSGD